MTICCLLCGDNVEEGGGLYDGTDACCACMEGLPDALEYYDREMKLRARWTEHRDLYCQMCGEPANGSDEPGGRHEGGGRWVHCRKCDAWTHHPDESEKGD